MKNVKPESRFLLVAHCKIIYLIEVKPQSLLVFNPLKYANTLPYKCLHKALMMRILPSDAAIDLFSQYKMELYYELHVILSV